MKHPLLPSFKNDSKRVVVISSSIAILASMIVLAGWELGIDVLKTGLPGYISMKANTAIGLACLALSNLLSVYEKESEQVHGPKYLRWFFTSTASAIGILTLAEYASGHGLGLDEFFFSDIAIDHSVPGRLAPVTATLFTLIGFAQFLGFSRKDSLAKPAQLLTLVSLMISLQAFLGYIYGSTHTFGAAFYTQMAVHTTLEVVLVCVGFLAATSTIGFMRLLGVNSIAGSSARKLIFWTVVLPPTLNLIIKIGQRAGLYNVDYEIVVQTTIGMTVFVSVILKYCSDLHQTTMKQKIEEEKFRSVTEVMPQMVWTADPNGKIDYINSRLREYYGGGSLEQVRDIVHPDDRQNQVTRWNYSLRTGEPYVIEYRLRKSDGAYRWHLGRAMPLRGNDGEITKWFGTSTDIQDQKKAVEERYELLAQQNETESKLLNEARFRAIFEAAFDAIISTDSTGMITDWNPRAELMFGWKRSEVLGQPMSQIVLAPEFRQAQERKLENISKWGEKVVHKTIEIEAIRRNGVRFPIQFSGTSIKVQNEFTYTAFIADITERKRNESELINARQVAMQAAETKAVFLANMSHEIRTPLNGVIGMADLLSDTSLNEEQARFAKIIQDSGTSLMNIINDILDFSKIDAGKLRLEETSFHAVSLIESQAELLMSKAAQKGLSLYTFIDPVLPSQLLGDPGRIGQILLNLISNAIKFTEVGSVLISATPVSAAEGLITIRFSVKDTGIGVDPETQLKLFQPFTQADGSTARKYGGTGLGLSISKLLVDLMKGRIGVKSQVNAGSEFWFEIPLKSLEEITGSSGFITLPGSKPPHVLVIDDDIQALDVTAKYLRSWKMECTLVSDREVAREKLAFNFSNEFDVVILDRKMQNFGSFDLNGKPIILTSSLDDDRSDLAHPAQAFFYLRKPIRQSDLYDAISTMVYGKNLHKSTNGQKNSVLAIPTNPFRILIAEDNSVNQMLTLAQLKKLGYSAHAVANGKEVLEELLGSNYDLILMDCQMPEMDGFETTREIRRSIQESTRDIPIIALTANAMQHDKELCFAAGMNDFISKPTKTEALSEALTKWLVHEQKLKSRLG